MKYLLNKLKNAARGFTPLEVKTFRVLPTRLRVGPLTGFTLIETFVAISILMTAVMAPLTIASQGLNSALTANDQTTASYLAQDAIEYIRWVRDTNTLSGNPWLTNLQNCISAGGTKTCRFDSTLAPDPTTNIVSCVGLCPNKPLFYSPTSGFYTYDSTQQPTKFTRAVTITNPANGRNDEALVTVTVLWRSGALVRQLVIQSDLFRLQ